MATLVITIFMSSSKKFLFIFSCRQNSRHLQIKHDIKLHERSSEGPGAYSLCHNSGYGIYVHCYPLPAQAALVSPGGAAGAALWSPSLKGFCDLQLI